MKVIQLLNWKLNTIEKELENIKNQGFDAIQINPMQPFKEEQQFHWWSFSPPDFLRGRFHPITPASIPRRHSEAAGRGNLLMDCADVQLGTRRLPRPYGLAMTVVLRLVLLDSAGQLSNLVCGVSDPALQKKESGIK